MACAKSDLYSWLLLGGATFCLISTDVMAAPVSVAGFTFADGELAFADDAFLVSGTIRFNCATAAAGPASSVSEALVGYDLERCVNNNTGNSGVVEVVFSDNFIQNLPGPDLVVFELSGALPVGTGDPRENFGISIYNGTSFSAFSYFDPIATGTNSCGDPSLCLDTFAVEIDLSEFGILDGGLVNRIQLQIFDVGLGTKSADIAALGALNSVVPEPSTALLLAIGLVGIAAVRRRPGRNEYIDR